MKRFTLIITSVVLGFMMAACSTPSPKQAIMQDTDNFFAQAEQEVQGITNAEDFVNFFYEFEDRRDGFVEEMFNKYPTDKDGNLKGMTETEIEELNDYMYNRATEFNKIEAQKCGEFLTPYLDEFETTTKRLYANFIGINVLSEGQIQELYDAYEGVSMFEGIDNVPNELVDRYNAVLEMVNKMLPGDEEE